MVLKKLPSSKSKAVIGDIGVYGEVEAILKVKEGKNRRHMR